MVTNSKNAFGPGRNHCEAQANIVPLCRKFASSPKGELIMKTNYNKPGLRIVQAGEATNPTRTQLAQLRAQRDKQRIEYFIRGISERVRPTTPTEVECVRQMAVATWKLKGSDMAERELSREAARLLGPFKQEAYDDYMSALKRLNAIRAMRTPTKKAA